SDDSGNSSGSGGAGNAQAGKGGGLGTGGSSGGAASGGSAGLGPDGCLDRAYIDEEDSAGDIAALQGITCINTLYVESSTLTSLEGLESLSKATEILVGDTPPLSFDALGNPNLTSLKGLEGLRELTFLTIEGNPQLTDLT